MLNMPIRNDTAAASPVKSSGVAATSVPDSAPSEVTAALEDALVGVERVVARGQAQQHAPTARAATKEASGTATLSQRGTPTRRSSRITGVPAGSAGAAAHEQAELRDVGVVAGDPLATRPS